MNENLFNVLLQNGKNPANFRSPDGSEVLILPHGGRILGLFPAHSQENFYWTNSALEKTDTAMRLFSSDQWQNTGGDRTWLAPEIDFFFPNFPDRSVYFQPRQLDPGSFRLSQENGHVRLINEFVIVPSRYGVQLQLRLTKTILPALNPLRHERDISDLHEIQYAGYTLQSSLEMLNNTALLGHVGLWNLVQMPHRGQMFFPTFGRSQPQLCFGQVDSGDLTVTDHFVRYAMQASGEHKICLRAVQATGRVGYLYGSETHKNLIIRNFSVNPSGEYIDVLWNDPDYLGFAIQACNVNSGLGSFSELEYHIPAIGKTTGKTRCDDTAQVWAFRGTTETIHMIARRLLGAVL